MKKIISLLFILILLSSCDPAYYILISNRTNYDKQIQVKAFSNPVEYRETKEDAFKVGELIKT